MEAANGSAERTGSGRGKPEAGVGNRKRAQGSAMATFRELGLAPWLAEQARQVGLSRPTAVQAACIPPVLQGERGAAPGPPDPSP